MPLKNNLSKLTPDQFLSKMQDLINIYMESNIKFIDTNKLRSHSISDSERTRILVDIHNASHEVKMLKHEMFNVKLDPSVRAFKSYIPNQNGDTIYSIYGKDIFTKKEALIYWFNDDRYNKISVIVFKHKPDTNDWVIKDRSIIQLYHSTSDFGELLKQYNFGELQRTT